MRNSKRKRKGEERQIRADRQAVRHAWGEREGICLER